MCAKVPASCGREPLREPLPEHQLGARQGMGVFLVILNDIRSASNGHLRVSFFTSPNAACSIIQLTKWVSSPDEESDLSLFPIYCICWSLRNYRAVTHLHSFTDDTSFFWGSALNGSSLASPVHPQPAGKRSSGPSGKPCPGCVSACWTIVSPTVGLVPVCHLLNTNTMV